MIYDPNSIYNNYINPQETYNIYNKILYEVKDLCNSGIDIFFIKFIEQTTKIINSIIILSKNDCNVQTYTLLRDVFDHYIRFYFIYLYPKIMNLSIEDGIEHYNENYNYYEKLAIESLYNITQLPSLSNLVEYNNNLNYVKHDNLRNTLNMCKDIDKHNNKHTYECFYHLFYRKSSEITHGSEIILYPQEFDLGPNDGMSLCFLIEMWRFLYLLTNNKDIKNKIKKCYNDIDKTNNRLEKGQHIFEQ